MATLTSLTSPPRSVSLARTLRDGIANSPFQQDVAMEMREMGLRPRCDVCLSTPRQPLSSRI